MDGVEHHSRGLPDRRQFNRLLAGALLVAAVSACSASAGRVASGTASPTTPVPSTPVPSTTPSSAPPSLPQSPSTPAVGSLAPGPRSPARHLARQYSLSDPASPWVLVNKHHRLQPVDYVPPDLVELAVPRATSGEASLLRRMAADAAGPLFAEATAAGVGLVLLSGYRSHDTQAATYESWLQVHGGADGADTVSARAGYSEHQTGLALDLGDAEGVCGFDPCFAATPAAAWVAANCTRFGFIVRYPSGDRAVTGYDGEPWHLRYVGLELAQDLAHRGIPTLEEYFGAEAAPDYLPG